MEQSVIVPMDDQHPVVLFDGVCTMCNGFVNFVLQRDPQAKFRFASLQSPYGLQTLKKLGIPCDLTTIVLVEPDGTYFLRSSAILKIAEQLTFPWSVASYFLCFPAPLRDIGYWCVSQSRYYLFGHTENVCVYNPDWKQRFLSECSSSNSDKTA